MLSMRRDSYALLREQLRWRVALVLASLIVVLMVALGALNTRLGYGDTAFLAYSVMAVAAGCLVGLLMLPRGLGGQLFFIAIVLLLWLVPAFGLTHGRPLQHWAYILPPALVFLMRAQPALLGMIGYGAFVCWTIHGLVPMIDVVRFASGYGLLVCFMYTYALLQERAAEMLRYHSDHDALTNCLNRRTFNELVEQIGQGPRARVCTFLLIDIDHFKAINDSHGHLVGDRVITEVAAALGRTMNPQTPLFRYGGEEFAVLLVDADADAGIALAEKLRRAAGASDPHGVAVTVSIGLAEWRVGDGPVTSALARADAALYEAKRGGRNRVVAAGRQSAGFCSSTSR